MSDLPAQITYRRMTAADLDACVALSTLQGWNQLRDDWVMLREFHPDGCFVAAAGDRLVGTLTSIDYGGRFSWIGMVLVHPDMRRRGIGRGLLAAALEALSSCETIKLDATPAGRTLYEQLGFVDEYELGRLTAPTATWPTLPPVTGAIEPLQPADLDEVASLDAPVFGGDRRHVLSAWRQRFPPAAVRLRRGGRIAGYAMGRPGAKFDMIGPVIATSPTDACALAAAVGRSFGTRPLGIDVVARQVDFRTWLETCGFALQRPLLRMARGPNRFPGLPERQFGVLGPEIG